MSIKAQTPEQTTEVFAHYFNAGNIDDLIAAYYADGAVLAAAPGSGTQGSALRTALSQYFALKGKITATTRHKLVAGDTALLLIDWVIEATDGQGKPLRVPGTSTDVVRRGADGVWRCIIDNPHGIS